MANSIKQKILKSQARKCLCLCTFKTTATVNSKSDKQQQGHVANGWIKWRKSH
jgi:hypothetical protein